MAGTRGGVGRIAAMAIALAVLLLLALAGTARAGVFQVAQCGWGIGTDLDSTMPAIEGSGFRLDPGGCGAPIGSGPVGMGFEGAVAPDGVRGIARARWVAPPGTTFTAAHLTWFGSAEPGNWYGLGTDVDNRFQILADSFGRTPPARLDLPIEGHAWAVEAWLQCLMSGPSVDCTRSTPSTMWLRELVFVLADPVAPTAALGGALAGDGWHRGTAPLAIDAADSGSGVASAAATIDGKAAIVDAPGCATTTIEGVPTGTRMQPCPPTATQAIEVDTTALADGPHTVRGCATDFAGDQGCAPDREVDVDNSAPTPAFAAAALGQVAATVRDRFSGPATGTISFRRGEAEPWADLPTSFDRDGGSATLTAPLPELSAGTYLFRATATDVAGNTGSAEERVSGTAAEVREQVAKGRGGGGSGPGAGDGKAPAPRGGGHRHSPKRGGRPVHLTARLLPQADPAPSAHPIPAAAPTSRAASPRSDDDAGGADLTVDYGDGAKVRGRLTDSHGAGVAARPVVIVTRASAGIGRRPSRRRVVTDRAGRFALRLPPGTSRRVTVAFHGGGGLAPARAHPLALRVRAAVTLTAEPLRLWTGESVALAGRVTPGAARIPKRGKVVTIQYLERASGRWRPALVVRTDRRGRFRASYRFRYITGEARIHLRATALPEAGWPYAEGSSPPVTLTVSG
jgi:hypothetical protein